MDTGYTVYRALGIVFSLVIKLYPFTLAQPEFVLFFGSHSLKLVHCFWSHNLFPSIRSSKQPQPEHVNQNN